MEVEPFATPSGVLPRKRTTITNEKVVALYEQHRDLSEALIMRAREAARQARTDPRLTEYGAEEKIRDAIGEIKKDVEALAQRFDADRFYEHARSERAKLLRPSVLFHAQAEDGLSREDQLEMERDVRRHVQALYAEKGETGVWQFALRALEAGDVAALRALYITSPSLRVLSDEHRATLADRWLRKTRPEEAALADEWENLAVVFRLDRGATIDAIVRDTGLDSLMEYHPTRSGATWMQEVLARSANRDADGGAT